MILALDLALTTGWATWDGTERQCGIWDIKALCECERPGKDRSPEPALWIYQHVSGNIRNGVECVVFESAFTMHAVSAWIQNSMQTAVMLACIDNDTRWSRHRATVWKKHMLGNGTAKPATYHRRAVVKWPEVDIQTDDEAAALWLLEMELQGVATK